MFTAADNRNLIAAMGGQTVTVTRYGLTEATLTGIFDAEVDTVDGRDPSMVVTRPQVTLVEADAGVLTRDHTLTIGGKDYRLYGEPRRNDGLIVYLLVTA